MSEHQPLLQISTPIRHGEEPQVVLRLDSDQDVAKAMVLINEASEKLAPLTVGLAATVARLIEGGGELVSQLQQAGLNPVPMAAPPQAAPVYQPPPAQPVYQPQAQASQQYQPQQTMVQGQATSTPLTGPCWAASPRKMHNAECKDCGAPTLLTVKDLRSGKTVNGHVCTRDSQHKITWCEELIWNSKVVQANGQGIATDPRLVTG